MNLILSLANQLGIEQDKFIDVIAEELEKLRSCKHKEKLKETREENRRLRLIMRRMKRGD
ncbi:hypothetical protein [Halocella sp. SP3-1]|uniref:hypothetical protein n=1 Tax=Halocella sp. SP3-1 TaxID=2382161 RepID=UPI000F74ED36|nr:hypothetical protein [Halocella sp. SP3-1]AZO96161.1 hypothetical protein D7D81_17045 [Halocella sp. SP3-1]